MAGVMPRIVNAVNRTTHPLDAMFDGQPVVIPPGYKVIFDDDDKEQRKPRIVGAGPGESVLTYPLPYFAAEMVKRQNPLMGSEDPGNPRDFESLIAIVEWDDDTSHLEQSDSEERLDRELLDDEGRSATKVKTSLGRKQKRQKRGKGGRAYTDERLRNPTGIRANYEG